MAKKVIALLLILSMMVTGFTVTTSAAATQKKIDGVTYSVVTNEDDFVTALQDGKNIMLGADIELTTEYFATGRAFGIKPGVIIDGGGYTLSYTKTRTTSLFNFNNGERLANGTITIRNISFGSKASPITINGSDGLLKYTNALGCEIVLENVNFYVVKKAVKANSGAIFAKLGTIIHFRDCMLDIDMTDITGGSLHGGWIGEVVSPGQVEFENCTTVGTITAPGGAAGFVGQNTTGLLKLTNCKNFANVTAPLYTAGFVANMGAGADATYATDCINYGTVTSTGSTYDSIAGGIYGRVSNRAIQSTGRVHVVYGCSNYGKITAGNTAGGIIGRNHDYDYDGRTYIAIGSSSNFGAIDGPSYAGGIIGAGSPMAYCVELTDCVNIGTITSANGYAGNFAGVVSGGASISGAAVREGSVKGGFAAGVVSGKTVGAIAGLDSGTYKIGAGTYAGKFVGVSTPKYENVTYYGTQTTVPTGVTKITDKTALLADLSAYLGKTVIAADAGNTTAHVVLAAPVLRGIQLGTAKGNTVSIRLVAGTYAKDAYKSYGYEVTVIRADGTSSDFSCNASALVSEVKETVDGKETPILAGNVAATYLYTAALKGVPANENVTVKIVPVAEGMDGTKYTGTTKMLKFVNGRVTNETMALNGTLLESFAIVYESTNKLAEKTLATHLSKKIAELTGVYVPVISETTKHQRTYEILIGKTNRTETVPAGRSIITLDNSASIAITGDNTAQLGEAVQYFIELLEAKVNASDNALNITSPIQAPAQSDISLMTFNMGAKDNTTIKQHEWDLIVEYLPDIFTSQEPWAGFLDDFCNSYAVRPATKFQASSADDDVMSTDVDNKAFTGNDYYGIYWGMPRWVPGGQNNQGKASYSVVFYAKDRFTVNEEKSGTFWFSDTPDVVGSKITGSSHPRCATYVTLTDVNTGKEFVVVNVHLDHVAKQTEQATILINELIKRVGKDTPMMITGDMNSGFTSGAIQYMLNNTTMPLTSSDTLAEEIYYSDGPFGSGTIIDWIFFNTPEKVDVGLYRYCKDYNMFNNLWNSTLSMGMPSDHPAVYVEFKLK
ncbi:MAG: hypothetical protein IJW49_05140 [Clostridia bacterium]|nr:hypothetical protein [Clostridia bacterium]